MRKVIFSGGDTDLLDYKFTTTIGWQIYRFLRP